MPKINWPTLHAPPSFGDEQLGIQPPKEIREQHAALIESHNKVSETRQRIEDSLASDTPDAIAVTGHFQLEEQTTEELAHRKALDAYLNNAKNWALKLANEIASEAPAAKDKLLKALHDLDFVGDGVRVDMRVPGHIMPHAIITHPWLVRARARNTAAHNAAQTCGQLAKQNADGIKQIHDRQERARDRAARAVVGAA